MKKTPSVNINENVFNFLVNMTMLDCCSEYTKVLHSREAGRRSRKAQAIEAGLLGAIFVKNLSRLGRDYLKCRHYAEHFFPNGAVSQGIEIGW